MKFKNLFLFLALAFFLSFSVQAHNDRTRDRVSVGAPLDGGLLTILGAAGVAYYVSRKKKKNGDTL